MIQDIEGIRKQVEQLKHDNAVLTKENQELKMELTTPKNTYEETLLVKELSILQGKYDKAIEFLKLVL